MLKREMYLSKIRGFYDSDLVKILVGIRRCGKSVILKQIMNELKEKGVDKEHIIYINFELIETVLSGRYVLFNIYPLSYKEFVELTGKTAKSEETFWNFIKWGGLPNRTQFTDEGNIKDYLYSVFDSIILRDVVERLGLKDTVLFNLLLQYIVDTTGRQFSARNVINFLKNKGKSVSTETLYMYLDALCKALMIKKIYRYDIHGKAILKTLNKYYMTDLGIAQIKNNNFEINKSFAIENVVYIEDNFPKYVLSLDRADFSQDGIIHKNIIDWLLEV